MTARTLISLVILTALAAFTFTLAQRDGPVAPTPTESLPEGYYLKGARLRSTDQNGLLTYELKAERIDERPSTRSIELSDLQLDYGNENNQWRLEARSGRMPASNDRIHLEGGVRAKLLNVAAHGATRFFSERMVVDINGQTASTSDPVTVEFQSGRLEALGLDVNLADETLQLRGNVRGVFKPPPR
ncbi:MAG: LPS export ABC transporter periplasmic protein LptC [Pseudomonadota bacterium]